MKANKLLEKSFLRTCITYFILCSLLVTVLNTLANTVIAWQLDNAFPSIHTLLQYEEALEEDDFAAIPMRKFENCAFLVYGEDSRLLYASDNRFRDQLLAEDLWMINEYDSGLYYSVQEMTSMPESTQYFIALHRMRPETGVTEFVDYCLVDSSYTILDGDLFPWLDRLTEREFELLQGIYQSQWELSKAVFNASDGAERTLIFVAPRFSENAYNKALSRTNRLSLLSLPILLVSICVLAALFSRKIRCAIRPLGEAITAYGAGGRGDVDTRTLPVEFRDVADSFLHLRDQLEQVDAEKKAMEAEKQRVLADLSHDLKTPLTVMQGYAQALVDGVVPPEKQRQYLETICRKAAASTVLMNTLFDYVRLDHPDYQLHTVRADLSEFCKAYLAEKYPEIESRGFALTPDLPEGPVLLPFDAALLRRLLDNLLSNALQYNPAGTTLYASLAADGGWALLTIGDDGVGIPPELADTLFEPFVTSNRARTPGGGTGLGMAIVKKAAELHGGSIRLVRPPHPPMHTEFALRLPLAPPTE